MNLHISWYIYIGAGFAIGAYLHNALTRHVLHWVAIKILRGFIWMLQKTDKYHRTEKPQRVENPKATPKPVAEMPKVIRNKVATTEDELESWLSQNPDISLGKR